MCHTLLESNYVFLINKSFSPKEEGFENGRGGGKMYDNKEGGLGVEGGGGVDSII